MVWKVIQELRSGLRIFNDDDDDYNYDAGGSDDVRLPMIRIEGIGLFSGRPLWTTESVWKL